MDRVYTFRLDPPNSTRSIPGSPRRRRFFVVCKLTFASQGLRWLQALAGTRRVLGWRVLPPLQTGQHGEVGTVRQPGEFCGQPGAQKYKVE